MKTLNDILTYSPQLAKLEYGAEPPIAEMILQYYEGYGIERAKAVKLTKDYINALKEYVK